MVIQATGFNLSIIGVVVNNAHMAVAVTHVFVKLDKLTLLETNLLS